jgi:pyruvate dehydrogenase E2 component (dihydrolipoamide acetyltransferase)
MPDFLMPSLGADMDRGTILHWHKQPGERIERGEIVVLVDTDKAEIEVESWIAGWLDEVLVREGETAPVGAAIARIAPDGGAAQRRQRHAPAARARGTGRPAGRACGADTRACRVSGRSAHPRLAARAPPGRGSRRRSRSAERHRPGGRDHARGRRARGSAAGGGARSRRSSRSR